jgi:DUF4097 and DUF4098 domain-containing protein YvlB
VPSVCKMNISGVSNTALIQGIEGEMHISTVSGDITLKDLKGQFNLKAVSGNVSGERLSGVLSVNTVSGDIRFGDSNFTSMDGKTISGDIEAETYLGTGPYSFDAVSGDVGLIVPAESRFSAHSSSLSGSLKSFLPVDRTGRDESEIMIKHHSISGNIHIEPFQTSKPMPVEGTKTSVINERVNILERLARKEISVEEALQLLNNKPVPSQ